MATIYVIGTIHDFQENDGSRNKNEIDAFIYYLEQVCQEHGIRAIAEEMNLEALGKLRQRESTCKYVADKLNLIHRYCDPNSGLRAKHGIIEDTIIKMDAFMNDLSEEEVNNKIRAEHEKRELIWINEIQKIGKFPILFICGAKHSLPFSQLLRNKGFQSIVINNRWTPSIEHLSDS